MQKAKKIIFVHSLNNFTGSPNVLALVIKGMIERGYSVELHTSKTKGFLSEIPGVKYHYTIYRWCSNSANTALLLFFSQLQLFFRLLFSRRINTIYYINTIVPFGAALACWISRKKFVFHIHENMQQNKALYALLRRMYSITNQKSIFVSEYLRNTAVNCKNGIVVYNALNEEFISKIPRLKYRHGAKGTILMVASLRRFKGIYEFALLAKKLPQYPFKLVLSASKEEVDQFTTEIGSLPNLKVFSTQINLHPFYQEAALLLQLSHPKSCVETFGLTILEAMVYGMPAIVPNVGGPTELVENGVNGFQINPHELEVVATKIIELMENEEMYRAFSTASIEKSKQFDVEKMLEQIENYITE